METCTNIRERWGSLEEKETKNEWKRLRATFRFLFLLAASFELFLLLLHPFPFHLRSVSLSPSLCLSFFSHRLGAFMNLERVKNPRQRCPFALSETSLHMRTLSRVKIYSRCKILFSFFLLVPTPWFFNSWTIPVIWIHAIRMTFFRKKKKKISMQLDGTSRCHSSCHFEIGSFQTSQVFT